MSAPKQDWRRPAVLAAILLALVVYTLLRAVPERSNVDRLEAQLASYPVEGMDDGPVPLARYTRYYADAGPRTVADLRIAAPATLRLPRGKTVIVGVLVDPVASGHGGKPGIRRVRLADLPLIGDGGCDIIDVVYDPAQDEILDARCHGSLTPPAPPIAAPAGG